MVNNSEIIGLVCVLIFFDAIKVSKTSLGGLNYARHRRESGNIECALPPFPENGEWKLLSETGQPGEKVPKATVIQFKCNNGYKLSTQSPYAVCDEEWSSSPTCEKLCPPVFPSQTYTLKCMNKMGMKTSCSEATDGTYLEFDCAPFYETQVGSKTRLCKDGSWNYPKPICLPVCGKKLGDIAKPLVFGSTPNKKLEYPWIAAIYQKVKNGSYVNICGGSILSLKVVVTAAHCVTNDEAVVKPKEDYMIGAGKLYNKYQAEDDNHAQYLELLKIIVHENYKGEHRRFLADIAALVVKGQFHISEVIQPVCFNSVDTIYLHVGSEGEVSGWGLSEGGLPSEVLRTLKIPLKNQETCAAELPPEFADKYNLGDKICTGFYNQSTSVCEGDSGSGLTFKNPDNNRYYIHGIVSLGPAGNGHCDIQQNSLYTKVAQYYEFVDRILSRYTSEGNTCILPPHPQNGRWVISIQGKNPGDVVSSSTILKIICNIGYKVSSTTNIDCSSAQNMPTCRKLCPTLNFPKGTNYQCANSDGQIINCLDAIDGSILAYTCPNGYKIPQGTVNVRTCVKGSWGTPQPECLPKPVKSLNCGKGVNTSYEQGLEYPWNVAVYKKKKGYNMYICGASLISHRLVLTAARCVTDEKNYTILPKQNYVIAAGKTNAIYNDPKEINAQYSEISNMIIHERYGSNNQYLADIALLVTPKSFTFNNFVQPVCFKDVNSIQLQPEDAAVVWGWAVEKKTIMLYKHKHTVVTYQSPETCDQTLPQKWTHKFDTICGTFPIGSTGICRSDLGRGFIVKDPEDERYYLHGVVSVSPNSKTLCQQNFLATNVSSYYDFIDNVLSQY